MEEIIQKIQEQIGASICRCLSCSLSGKLACRSIRTGWSSQPQEPVVPAWPMIWPVARQTVGVERSWHSPTKERARYRSSPSTYYRCGANERWPSVGSYSGLDQHPRQRMTWIWGLKSPAPFETQEHSPVPPYRCFFVAFLLRSGLVRILARFFSEPEIFTWQMRETTFGPVSQRCQPFVAFQLASSMISACTGSPCRKCRSVFDH